MADEPEDCRLTVEQALAMLPDGDDIHTFVNPGRMLVGADWRRMDVERAVRESDVRKLTGPMAMSMNHGLAINYMDRPLFIETRKGGV